MSHYGAFEGDVEDLAYRSRSRRTAVGLGLIFVAACVGVVAVTSFRSGWGTPHSAIFMTLPKESAAQGQLCAPWPEFCLEQPKCLARYHQGDPSNPVTNDPGLLTQYYGDCESYCTECDCPGNFYCSKLQYAFSDTTSELTPTEWYPGIAEKLACAGYEGTGVGSDKWPITPEDPDESPLVKTPVADMLVHGTPFPELEPSFGKCEWVGAGYYSMKHREYPACNAGAELYGLAEGGYCCRNDIASASAEIKGHGCEPGEEGNTEGDVICAAYHNPVPGDVPLCNYDNSTAPLCQLAWGEANWIDVDFRTTMTFKGDGAGPFVNMVHPTDPMSDRYWLRLSHEDAGLYRVSNQGEIERMEPGPVPIHEWTFEKDEWPIADNIGDLDLYQSTMHDSYGEWQTDVAGSNFREGLDWVDDHVEQLPNNAYVDEAEGALVLDGSSIVHSRVDDGYELQRYSIAVWLAPGSLDQQDAAGIVGVERQSEYEWDSLVFDVGGEDAFAAASSNYDRDAKAEPMEELKKFNANELDHLVLVYGRNDVNPNYDTDTFLSVYLNGERVGRYDYEDAAAYAKGDWGIVLGARRFWNNVHEPPPPGPDFFKVKKPKKGKKGKGKKPEAPPPEPDPVTSTFICDGNCFEGKIYKVTVYDNALSYNEVNAIYKDDRLKHGLLLEEGDTYQVQLKSMYNDMGASGDAGHPKWYEGFCEYVAGVYQVMDGETKFTIKQEHKCDDMIRHIGYEKNPETGETTEITETIPGCDADGIVHEGGYYSKPGWWGKSHKYSKEEKQARACIYGMHEEQDGYKGADCMTDTLGRSHSGCHVSLRIGDEVEWYDGYVHGREINMKEWVQGRYKHAVMKGFSLQWFDPTQKEFNDAIANQDINAIRGKSYANVFDEGDQVEVWALKESDGQRLEALIDNEVIVDITDNTVMSGGVGFATYHASMEAFGVKVLDKEGMKKGPTPFTGEMKSTGYARIFVDGEPLMSTKAIKLPFANPAAQQPENAMENSGYDFLTGRDPMNSATDIVVPRNYENIAVVVYQPFYPGYISVDDEKSTNCAEAGYYEIDNDAACRSATMGSGWLYTDAADQRSGLAPDATFFDTDPTKEPAYMPGYSDGESPPQFLDSPSGGHAAKVEMDDYAEDMPVGCIRGRKSGAWGINWKNGSYPTRNATGHIDWIVTKLPARASEPDSGVLGTCSYTSVVTRIVQPPAPAEVKAHPLETCDLSLVTQTSDEACTEAVSYKCVNQNTMEVSEGCAGVFMCQGHRVPECASEVEAEDGFGGFLFGTTQCTCIQPAPEARRAGAKAAEKTAPKKTAMRKGAGHASRAVSAKRATDAAKRRRRLAETATAKDDTPMPEVRPTDLENVMSEADGAVDEDPPPAEIVEALDDGEDAGSEEFELNEDALVENVTPEQMNEIVELVEEAAEDDVPLGTELEGIISADEPEEAMEEEDEDEAKPIPQHDEKVSVSDFKEILEEHYEKDPDLPEVEPEDIPEGFDSLPEYKASLAPSTDAAIHDILHEIGDAAVEHEAEEDETYEVDPPELITVEEAEELGVPPEEMEPEDPPIITEDIHVVTEGACVCGDVAYDRDANEGEGGFRDRMEEFCHIDVEGVVVNHVCDGTFAVSGDENVDLETALLETDGEKGVNCTACTGSCTHPQEYTYEKEMNQAKCGQPSNVEGQFPEYEDNYDCVCENPCVLVQHTALRINGGSSHTDGATLIGVVGDTADCWPLAQQWLQEEGTPHKESQYKYAQKRPRFYDSGPGSEPEGRLGACPPGLVDFGTEDCYSLQPNKHFLESVTGIWLHRIYEEGDDYGVRLDKFERECFFTSDEECGSFPEPDPRFPPKWQCFVYTDPGIQFAVDWYGNNGVETNHGGALDETMAKVAPHYGKLKTYDSCYTIQKEEPGSGDCKEEKGGECIEWTNQDTFTKTICPGYQEDYSCMVHHQQPKAFSMYLSDHPAASLSGGGDGNGDEIITDKVPDDWICIESNVEPPTDEWGLDWIDPHYNATRIQYGAKYAKVYSHHGRAWHTGSYKQKGQDNSRLNVYHSHHTYPHWQEASAVTNYHQAGPVARPGAEWIGVGRNNDPHANALYCVKQGATLSPPPTDSILYGGSFEMPMAKTWNTAASRDDVALMPPGWIVDEMEVNWGKFQQTHNMCQGDCAFDGQQFLDLCGQHIGKIHQTVDLAEQHPGEFELRYAINAHPNCGNPLKVTNVLLRFNEGPERLIAQDRKERPFVKGRNPQLFGMHPYWGWTMFANQWSPVMHNITIPPEVFEGPGPHNITIGFEAVDDENSCGCMLMDDIQLLTEEDAKRPRNNMGGAFWHYDTQGWPGLHSKNVLGLKRDVSDWLMP